MAGEKETEPRDGPNERILHSYIWSAFAARRNYEATRFDDRYKLFRVEDAIEYLRDTSDEPRSDSRDTDLETVNWWLCQIGLWHAGVRIKYLSSKHGEVRGLFSKRMGFEFGAMRHSGQDRPVVPNLLQLGVEDVTVETEFYRTSVRVRMEAHVARPYYLLRDIVLPSRWKLSPFWRELPTDSFDPSWFEGPKVVHAKVRLPGGNREDEDKSRPVSLKIELARSAFQSRLDYEGEDLGTERRKEEMDSEGRFRKELGRFTGYLLVEKLEGRPGWCRIVMDRRASFGHVNHHFLCKETLWYWLTADLVSVVVITPREAHATADAENGESPRRDAGATPAPDDPRDARARPAPDEPRDARARPAPDEPRDAPSPGGGRSRRGSRPEDDWRDREGRGDAPERDRGDDKPTRDPGRDAPL